jgi:hypothetical protein
VITRDEAHRDKSRLQIDAVVKHTLMFAKILPTHASNVRNNAKSEAIKLKKKITIIQRIFTTLKNARTLKKLKRYKSKNELARKAASFVRNKVKWLVPMALRPLGKCGPIVVARRWDRLGGRLGAILNAWSVAHALGIDFRFVWPTGEFQELNEPRELFNERFLAQFACRDTDLEGRIIERLPTHLSLQEARDFVQNIDRNVIFDISDCFEIITFLGEDRKSAHMRFRESLKEISWSVNAFALINSILGSRFPSNYAAIHVRAGDIVTGDWRQFVPVDKYLPSSYVELFIDRLSVNFKLKTVIFSDNIKYIKFLKDKFPSILTPDQLVPSYYKLTEIQRDFADILVLSCSKSITGPNSSAFSCLAANISNLKVIGVKEYISESEASEFLKHAIKNFKSRDLLPVVLHSLIARDICWFLDVFPDALSLEERIEFAAKALEFEPDFCSALNHLAIGKAMAAKPIESLNASTSSFRISETVICHSDPLLESIASSISSAVLNLGGGSANQLGSSIGSINSVAKRKESIFFEIARLKFDLDKCEALAPFQIHHSDVLLNIRFQLAFLKWLATADLHLTETVRNSLSLDMNDVSFFSDWRPSGFNMLRVTGSFPQVLRSIETVSIRVARALNAVLPSAVPQFSDVFHVDFVETTASGLRWVHGSAFKTITGLTQNAGERFSSRAFMYSDLRFNAPPNMINLIEPSIFSKGSFSFPVPLNECTKTVQ